MKALLFLLIFFQAFIYSQQVPTALSEMNNGKINFELSQGTKMIAGRWSEVASMPFPRYYGASIAYSDNDTTWLYIFGGDTTGSGDAAKTCLRYNVISDTWEYIDTLPVAMRVNSAAKLGNKLYTMGGFEKRNSDTASNKFFEYDVNTKVWTALPDLPEGIFYQKSFGYQDSLIYIIGGITGDSTFYRNKVLIYNVNTQTFRDATPLPEQRANFACVVLNDKIYITGGIFSNDSLSNKTITATIDPVNHSQISYVVGEDSTTFYPLKVHSHFGYPSGTDSLNFFGGSVAVGFSPVNNFYSLKIPSLDYDTLSNVPFTKTAFQSGYNYGPIGGGLDPVLIVIVAGGVTSGSAIANSTFIYRDSLNATGLDNEENNIPSGYSLTQNYPNPFNPSTTIQFSIPERSFVNLEVFNLLGQRVSTLVSDNLSAGTYKYIFDLKSSGKNLTSGTYFYRLTAGDFTETKKFLFIK